MEAIVETGGKAISVNQRLEQVSWDCRSVATCDEVLFGEPRFEQSFNASERTLLESQIANRGVAVESLYCRRLTREHDDIATDVLKIPDNGLERSSTIRQSHETFAPSHSNTLTTDENRTNDIAHLTT